MSRCSFNMYSIIVTYQVKPVEICEILNGFALKRQQAHSPGQSVAAPREQHDSYIRLERAKALIIKHLQFLHPICFYAFALSRRGDWRCLIPGVPLRSAPGYELAAPFGAHT